MRLRTAVAALTARSRPPVDLHDAAELPLRVWPRDVDALRHMNNGAYLSVMDLGRYDLIIRSGLYARLRSSRLFAVVSSETISFRRSLLPRQRYVLSTRVIGYDTVSIYTEQRFTVESEIYAVGLVRSRMLRRGVGPVPMAEVARLTHIDVSRTPPAWVASWASSVALPSTRAPYPTDW